jgi:hypothetical protein
VLISSVVATMITPMALGRMCLKMIRALLAPATRAASTNSRSRSERNSPRTSRARLAHRITPRKTANTVLLIVPKIRPMTAPMTIVGIVMTRSVVRMSNVSTRPRKNPASDPTATPMTHATSPMVSITLSDVWVPSITSAKMSRPISS